MSEPETLEAEFEGRNAVATRQTIFVPSGKYTKKGKPICFPVRIRKVEVVWMKTPIRFSIIKRKGSFQVSDSRHRGPSCDLDLTERGYSLAGFNPVLSKILGAFNAQRMLAFLME